MHLANYLGYLHEAELDLAEAFRKIGEAHAAEADVFHTGNTLAGQCETHAEKLGPRSPRSRIASTTNSSTRPVPAVSGCCATCTTSTSWRAPAISRGP